MTERLKIHNKSGQTGLKILQLSALDLNEVRLAYSRTKKISKKLLGMTECTYLENQDGRLSVESKKLTFGYHLVALDRFGKDQLQEVSASKSEKGAKTISHICGTPNCLSPEHLVLEEKTINDQRTHCHFVMNLAKEKSDALLIVKSLCPHEPKCGST